MRARPGFDLLAHPPGQSVQRIQVKTVTCGKNGFVQYRSEDVFDWLAAVLVGHPSKRRRVFLIPRAVVDERMRQGNDKLRLRWRGTAEMLTVYPEYEDNWALELAGRKSADLLTEPEA